MSALTDTTNTIAQEKETLGKEAVEAGIQKSTSAVEETDIALASKTTAEAEQCNVPKEITTDQVTKSKESDKTDEVCDTEAKNSEGSDVLATKNAVVVEDDKTSTEKLTTENTATDEADKTEKLTSENAVTAGDVKTLTENISTENGLAYEDVMVSTEKPPMEEETVETVEKETVQGETELSSTEKEAKLSENLISGRRFLKMNDYSKATDALSVAAALSAEIFGEGHEDTFEVNFLYGKALLELGKVEDEVLTNALTDMPKTNMEEESAKNDVVESPENMTQGERAEIKQKVEEALGITSEQSEPVEEGEVDEQKESNSEETEEAQLGGEKSFEKEITTVAEDVEMDVVEEPVTADEEGERSDEEAEDDEDPMKLSWELLETARCTCEKKIKNLDAENSDPELVKTWKLKLAEVHTSLGEHGMADSKYEQAQKDLAQAIAIQTIHLPPTSRILANTTHLLAKACSMDSLFEEAATHFNNVKEILSAKTEELKTQLEVTADEVKAEILLEISELEELIPEIDAFVVDARASAAQTEKLKEAAKKELENVVAMIGKIADKEATDITSMVRRPIKRPAEEETSEDIKKRKSGEGIEAEADKNNMETMEASDNAVPTPVK